MGEAIGERNRFEVSRSPGSARAIDPVQTDSTERRTQTPRQGRRLISALAWLVMLEMPAATLLAMFVTDPWLAASGLLERGLCHGVMSGLEGAGRVHAVALVHPDAWVTAYIVRRAVAHGHFSFVQ